ncbi:MAG TPA: polysaccharide biosynthesis tyrosine autokinase [Flavobacterium sp.]|uniref:GumC family protein n=1 Tax=Flavobacterium sp. TaxID=239 RepID=UPI002DBE9DB3|nr:polysaccharide biosynthesis tyrosine autokinase [Flavobacterium sp.]HEU4788929.1 polysaccharide biosynthesis tyrosine autokinase [Flavobacterium sp.]
MENSRLNEEFKNDYRFKSFLEKYILHWRWFAISACISFFLAFLYLRYATPEYKAITTVLVKDEKKGEMLSEMSAFADLGLGGGLKRNVDNEIEILKSRTLVERVIKKLNLNVFFLVEGRIIDGEIYEKTPIEVYFVDKTNEFYKNKIKLKFIELTPHTFSLENEILEDAPKVILSQKKEFKYMELIPTAYGRLIISKSKSAENKRSNKHQSIQIIVKPLGKVVESFRKRLEVEPISKTSSIVTISIKDPMEKKSVAFLDNLIQIYNEDVAADKTFISDNTSKFISNRLKLVTQELEGVEHNVQSFKRSNTLTNIDSEAKLFVEGSNDYDKKAVEAEIQLNVVSSMLDFINKSNNYELLPSNVITGQGDASGLISSYNQLVLDRNRILKSATTANPSVVKMDEQINSLKSTVRESLLQMQSNLIIQKRDLNMNEGILNTKIEKIPVQERQFRVIARQQKVKEELYLYLLQKREETAISLSASEPNIRVIDAAKTEELPVFPKKNIIYFAGLLLGFLVPFGIIYTDDLLDTKVKSILDIEGKTIIPFIGDIPTSQTSSKFIQADNRTSSAEGLRMIRTNLQFMLNKSPDGIAKTIFVTSTFPKEGKTFVSANLAAIFALSGKKVLLIGMDIRNPRLDEFMPLPELGVTNYLSSKNMVLKDLIVKCDGYKNFHILPSGMIPPNPTELLMSEKVDALFKTLKTQYDYIIVDNSPVSIVADTLLIAKNADCFIYVVRANFLDKRMLSIPNKLYNDQKLPNMCLLLNDTNSGKGYGYGYGYGVGMEKKVWYKVVFSKTKEMLGLTDKIVRKGWGKLIEIYAFHKR